MCFWKDECIYAQVEQDQWMKKCAKNTIFKLGYLCTPSQTRYWCKEKDAIEPPIQRDEPSLYSHYMMANLKKIGKRAHRQKMLNWYRASQTKKKISHKTMESPLYIQFQKTFFNCAKKFELRHIAFIVLLYMLYSPPLSKDEASNISIMPVNNQNQ